jgi:hypothetical protein
LHSSKYGIHKWIAVATSGWKQKYLYLHAEISTSFMLVFRETSAESDLLENQGKINYTENIMI